MRNYLIGTILASVALTGTAKAGEAYVGVSSGLTMPGNSSNEGAFNATVPATADWGEIPSGTSVGWNTDFKNGMVASGQLGYQMDSGLRAEIELSYASSDVKSHDSLAAGGAVIDGVDVAVLTRGAPDAANPTVGQVIADGQGKVKTLGVFLNAFYDINAGGGFEPYLGAGIGFQDVDVKFMPSGVPVADDSDSSLAWQAMAGASFAVSSSVELFGQFTYRENFDRANVELSLLPADLGVQSSQSMVTAGLRIKFGS